MIIDLGYFDPILLIGSTPATFSIEAGGRSRGRRWIGVVIGVVVVEIVVIGVVIGVVEIVVIGVVVVEIVVIGVVVVEIVVIIDGYDLA